jgi:hypothetical protein
VQPGVYRIEISKKGQSGKELVPARYNTASELGVEVANDTLRGGLNVELRGR